MTTVLGAATRAACAFTTQRASRASARRVIPRAASLRDAQPRGPIALLPRQRRRGDLAVAGGKGPGGGAFGAAEKCEPRERLWVRVGLAALRLVPMRHACKNKYLAFFHDARPCRATSYFALHTSPRAQARTVRG